MKTNCANDRCTEVHSSACVKYTGTGSPSLGIYCDDTLNTVLDTLIAKVAELEAKVADTCRLTIAGAIVSARNTAGTPIQFKIKLDNTDDRFTPTIYRVTSGGTETAYSSSYNSVTKIVTIDSVNGTNQTDFFRVTQGNCTAEFVMPLLGNNTSDTPTTNPL